MSYAELSQALFNVREKQRLLCEVELKCLEFSLQDPFLVKMLELYPLTKKSQKLLADSLEHQRMQAPRGAPSEIETNVHSAIYSGRRKKTARHLQQNYWAAQENIIDKTDHLLTEIFENKNALLQLRIAEFERYKIRQKKYVAGRLKTLTPLQSLTEIKSDFRDYIQYLRGLKQNGSRYAWCELSAILHRREQLKSETEREEANLLLLRALDDSRTAYHDKISGYVEGKGYTCQKGLEERLLDHHALILAAEKYLATNDMLEQLILTLTEPFVLRDLEQERPSCSQALYQLYLDAAGYKAVKKEDFYFEFMSDIDVNALKSDYLSTIKSGRLSLIRAQSDFQSFVAMMKDTPACDLEWAHHRLIAFLSQRAGRIQKVKKTRVHLDLPQTMPETDTIIENMIMQGPFIDKAHLEMVLALHDEQASLGFMAQAALSGTTGTGARFHLYRQDMLRSYKTYLDSQQVIFYHFITPQELTTKFSMYFHTVGCLQQVLCQWLTEYRPILSSAAERLAVLCAKSGYAAALKTLCQCGYISPDYRYKLGARGLLSFSAEYGHVECIRVLIAEGADVNLQNNRSLTALMMAAGCGQSQAVKELIQAGADINLQSVTGMTAVIFAVRNGSINALRALIEAGADLDLQDERGLTALILAARNGFTEALKDLIAAGAEVNCECDRGRTALMYAVSYCHSEAISVLVQAGAFYSNACFINPFIGMEILIWKTNILIQNIWQPSEIKPQIKKEEIIKGLESVDIAAVRANIAAGLNVNRLRDGRTALDIAIQVNSLALVKEILTAETLAPWAVIKAIKECFQEIHKRLDILNALLDHKNIVQLILRNRHQKSPLTVAQTGYILAIQAIKNNDGISLGDRDEEEALRIAKTVAHQALIMLLDEKPLLSSDRRLSMIFSQNLNDEKSRCSKATKALV